MCALRLGRVLDSLIRFSLAHVCVCVRECVSEKESETETTNQLSCCRTRNSFCWMCDVGIVCVRGFDKQFFNEMNLDTVST